MQYKRRLKELQNNIKQKNADVLIITNTVDILYLTGIKVSLGSIIITENDARFFIDSRYFKKCSHSPIKPYLKEKNEHLEFIESQSNGKPLVVAFDSLSTTYDTYIKLQEKLPHPRYELLPWKSPLQDLRVIKNDTELQTMRRAAALGIQGFEYACTLLKDGITEKEICNALEIFWLERGSPTSFDPIIAFGANTAMPHYEPGDFPLQPNQPVLMDIGVVVDYYCSDMTRMVWYGKPAAKILTIADIVHQAQKKALESCRPGITVTELDAIARGFIADRGYGEYFKHGLGHGVGLEIHEFPSVKKMEDNDVVLKPGMVITIEPGIYLPDHGGVRIEDTVVITEDSHEILTKIPSEPLLIM